ncbi:hypothetical protein K3495_g6443 [Podosphaera aphanis]|nr:hypothetical protein K3495_g6443 [Podosphaera aphanis]
MKRRPALLNSSTISLDLRWKKGLVDHLLHFEAAFQHIVSWYSELKRPIAVAFENFLCAKDGKVMCLFRSLPTSKVNIIDDLMTKDSIKSADANKRLLDPQSQKTVNGSHSKPYFVAKVSSPSL